MCGFFVVCAAFAISSASASVNFRGSGQFGKAQVDVLLLEELADMHHRLSQYEGEMRRLFDALPKNEYGNLGHDALRSMLHRFFVSRHGWYLHGLEPGSSAPDNTSVLEKDRVPLLLQDTLERKAAGRGASLHDTAAAAAAVEDLIGQEVDAHLKDAFAAAEVPMRDGLTRRDAYFVSKTFFMSFRIMHAWQVETKEQLMKKFVVFEERYPLYRNQGLSWLNETFQAEIGTDEDKLVDAKSVAKVANKVGEEYHTLNDGECAELRGTLQGMESRVPGRIRLSVFYNMTLHSHWRFNENMGALRALGALDESNPDQPSVIIANYATAKPNCFNASNIYDICCKNQCEDLMTHLESKIGSATSTADRIASLVANLPSESVSAPRELASTLRERLDQIAVHHGGQVPLHGRLFAQWLHHAYPLECPFPHEAGVANLQLWTGGEGDEASKAEMQRHVAADTCAVNWEGKIDCGEESAELPWSSKEELLQSVSTGRTADESGSLFRLVVMLLGLSAAAALVAAPSSLGTATNLRLDSAIKKSGLQRWQVAVAVLALTALSTGMLNFGVFGLATLGGVVAKFAIPRMGSHDLTLPTQQKFV